MVPRFSVLDHLEALNVRRARLFRYMHGATTYYGSAASAGAEFGEGHTNGHSVTLFLFLADRPVR